MAKTHTTKTRTSYKDLPEPKAPDVKVPKHTVTAIRIATQLWQNGEAYHAGAIDYVSWSTSNHQLWCEAERKDVDSEVKRILMRDIDNLVGYLGGRNRVGEK